MTAAVIQGTKVRSSSASSVTTPGITTSAGSVLAACAVCDTGTFSGVPPINDSKSNSWNQIDVEISNFGSTGGSQRMRLYYSELTSAGAGHTVTANLSAASPVTLLLVEIGGLSSGSFDKSNKGNVHAVAPGPFATGATPTTAQLIELIVGAIFGISSANPASHAVSGATPSAGWTVHSGAEETDGTVFYTGCLASVRVTNTGAYVASFTEVGNTDAGIYIATFKEASAAGQSPRARTIKTDRTLSIEGGRQRAFSPRRAMSGTRIQEAFSGAAVANSTLSAAGDATATFVGAAQGNSVLAAAGDATATFTGASKAAAVLSAAGDASATFTGAAKAASVLSAAADATASFTGAAKANSTLSAPGDSTAGFTGAALARGVLNAPGDSSLSFVGRADAAAVWNASGDASAAWIGSTGGNVLSADGDSSAIFVGAELAAAVLAAAGDSSALWSGTFTIPGGDELGARRPMRGRAKVRKPPKQRRPIYRHPEEVERERRMLEEYLESLETKARPASEEPVRPGESEDVPTRRAEPVAPRLSDVMARLASAQQLALIASAERVAKEDRAKAQKEHKRRRAAAIAVLMMSH